MASNATKFEEKLGVLPDFEHFFAEIHSKCFEAAQVVDHEDEYGSREC